MAEYGNEITVRVAYPVGKRVKLPRYLGSREGNVTVAPDISMVESEFTAVQLQIAMPRRSRAFDSRTSQTQRPNEGIVYVLTEHLELIRVHNSCPTCLCETDVEEEEEDEDDD